MLIVYKDKTKFAQGTEALYIGLKNHIQHDSPTSTKHKGTWTVVENVKRFCEVAQRVH